MFNKILIANRGEIACRIIRTAKKMGIKTAAIYSDIEVNAQHVKQADEAFYIGTAPSRDSYLQAEKIIAIALANQVDAIHPGYGFLSENAEFAAQCAAAGITFIGPSPAAIRAMGSKSAAKALMEQVGVPLVPGYHGENQDPELLLAEAKKIGFPILLKAAAGGGGKGMRVVWQEAEFFDALTSAKREALASFNDDKFLLEKYLTKPRHVEIQVFADQFANYVYLFERDCSIQRRHQKVIEEAPAPKISTELRQQIGAAAIAAAKAIQYLGAGTVEFLLDQDDTFYFMEMNTRLQVEHPVTEMITGQDLVAWQIQVAAGKSLPYTQEQLKITGHAFEARIYAEDPNNQFLPSIGEIVYLQVPNTSAAVRWDSAVVTHDKITPYYDPMIAKLIVWGTDRLQAIQNMQQALNQLQIVGVKTNTEFLKKIFTQETFIAEEFDTGFIAKYSELLLNTKHNVPAYIITAAALYLVLQQKLQAQNYATAKAQKNSPWFASDNWRLSLEQAQKISLLVAGQEILIEVTPQAEHYLIQMAETEYKMQGRLLDANHLEIILPQQQKIALTVVQLQQQLHIFDANQHYQFARHDVISDIILEEKNKGSLASPMPGTVIALFTEPGKTVNQGDKLMIIEAMKMEHTIHAPHAGTVKNIYFNVGDMVNEGVELLAIESN